MERAAWSDERLNHTNELALLRSDLRSEFRSLRVALTALRGTAITIGGGIMAAEVGVIAAILAAG